jgi:hypothetical protein
MILADIKQHTTKKDTGSKEAEKPKTSTKKTTKAKGSKTTKKGVKK